MYKIMKVGLIFGTRPEAIKMFALYKELKKIGKEVKVISTGQHKEMLYQVLNLFEMTVDYELNVMKEGQSLTELTSRLLKKLEDVVKKEKLDYIFVQGDTTSALVGALVGFYNNIPVIHIEAGLRTGNIYSPFPEEMNRKLIGNLATYHFAPTLDNVLNLRKEGILEEKIFQVGNTVIDSLLWIRDNKKNELEKIIEKYDLKNKKYILITLHRRENIGKKMEDILQGIKKYLNENKEIYLVFPVHKNPKVREVVKNSLKDIKNKLLIEPLEYFEFIALMERAHYIMTDSGGIQEEAPSLGKPTLVLRDTTERPEGVRAGTTKLVGVTSDSVYMHMKLLEGDMYKKMSHTKNPYGNGDAGYKIVTVLKKIGEL